MKRILTFALVICFLLSGCAGSDSKLTKTVLAMDTVMTLTIYGGTEQHLEEAGQLIKELDDKLSATNDASETNRINSSGGIAAEVSDKMLYLTKQSIALGSSTNGALDVTLTPVIRAWGFLGGDYRVPDNAELESLLEKVDYSKIETGNGTVTLPKGMEISFGAVAKGYAGDLLMELFSSQGIESAIVTLGGNVQALGLKPDGSKWNVAVQDPFSDGTLGMLQVDDKAVVTSGGYERYFEQDGETYWHIIDPATGRPANSGLVSVTIVCDSGVTADGLSTALFVMGLEEAIEYWKTNGGFDAVLVTDDGSVYVTKGIADSIELAEGYEKLIINKTENPPLLCNGGFSAYLFLFYRFQLTYQHCCKDKPKAYAHSGSHRLVVENNGEDNSEHCFQRQQY